MIRQDAESQALEKSRGSARDPAQPDDSLALPEMEALLGQKLGGKIGQPLCQGAEMSG